jgi:hypothetical protein
MSGTTSLEGGAQRSGQQKQSYWPIWGLMYQAVQQTMVLVDKSKATGRYAQPISALTATEGFLFPTPGLITGLRKGTPAHTAEKIRLRRDENEHLHRRRALNLLGLMATRNSDGNKARLEIGQRHATVDPTRAAVMDL